MAKDDYSTIEGIINISQEIFLNIHKLGNLEQNELIGSEEYKSVLNRLRELTMLEDSLYEKIDKNKYADIINYIFNEGENGLKDKLDLSIKNDSLLLAKARIYNRLNSLIETYLSADELDKIRQTMLKIAKINSALEIDLINTLLYLLNKYISDSKYSVYKEKLIQFKCNLAFLYKDVEVDLLDNNFAIDSSIYLTSKSVADLLMIIGYDNLKKVFSSSLICSYLPDLIVKKDTLIDEEDIIKGIIFRAIIIFSTEEKVIKMRDFLESEIKDISSNTLLNRLNMLIDICNSYVIDREEINMIGFRPYKN